MGEHQDPVASEITSAEEPVNLHDVALDNLKRRQGFRTHLIVYLAVNVALWTIWFVIAAVADAGWFPWAIFPTLGWGIGLAIHAWDTYGRKPITEDQVQHEIERLRDLS